MKTDIPLKRLAEPRGADLLPLLGLPAMMANASARLVEAVAQTVLRYAPDEQQADLLVIL